MRFGALSLLCASLLALAGCAAPSLPQTSDRAGKTLLVQPELIDGALRTQAVVNPKTAQDIATLEVVPYVYVGNDRYWPIDALTGEATDSSDPARIVKARKEGFDSSRATVIPLAGLRPTSRYRIVARAYDAANSLISTDDAGSWADVMVHEDDRPEFPLTLPVTLIDVPFGATHSIALQLTGGSFFQIRGTLYKVVDEALVLVPNATFMLAPDQAGRKVTLTNLEAQTTYRLKIDALDEAFLVKATQWHEMEITNDDKPVHADLPWEIP